MENKLKELLATVLEKNISDIDKNSSAATIDDWDSLRQMNIIVAIEEEFNIEFDEEETVLLNSFELLYEAIIERLK